MSDRRLQEGWTPGEKGMTPKAEEKPPSAPPPKPSDAGVSAKPPPKSADQRQP